MVSADMAKTAKGQTWHERYGQGAKITLKSQDGKLFDVDRELLTKHCSLVRASGGTTSVELEVAKRVKTEGVGGDDKDKSVDVVSSAQPIEVKVPSQNLVLFLDLLQLAQLDTYLDVCNISLDLGDARKALPVADRLKCDTVKDLIVQRMTTIASKDPWGILQLASELDDLPLAKIALRHVIIKPGSQTSSTAGPTLASPLSVGYSAPPGFTFSPPATPVKTFSFSNQMKSITDSDIRARLKSLQPLWQLELLSLLFTNEYLPVNGGYACMVQSDMKQLAGKFAPERHIKRGFKKG